VFDFQAWLAEVQRQARKFSGRQDRRLAGTIADFERLLTLTSFALFAVPFSSLALRGKDCQSMDCRASISKQRIVDVVYEKRG